MCIQELETRNIELTATARAMENAYNILASSKVESNSINTRRKVDLIAAGVSSLRAPLPAPVNEEDLKPTYDPEYHADLKFWEKRSWEPYSSRHHLHEFALEGGVPRFLENLDGTVIDKKTYEDLRSVVKTVFQELQDNGQAPETWSKRNVTALRFMRAQVYAHFPQVRECDNHWKIDVLCTRMYPDFTRDRSSHSRVAKAGSSHAKRQLSDVDETSESMSAHSRPSKRTKTAPVRLPPDSPSRLINTTPADVLPGTNIAAATAPSSPEATEPTVVQDNGTSQAQHTQSTRPGITGLTDVISDDMHNVLSSIPPIAPSSALPPAISALVAPLAPQAPGPGSTSNESLCQPDPSSSRSSSTSTRAPAAPSPTAVPASASTVTGPPLIPPTTPPSTPPASLNANLTVDDSSCNEGHPEAHPSTSESQPARNDSEHVPGPSTITVFDPLAKFRSTDSPSLPSLLSKVATPRTANGRAASARADTTEAGISGTPSASTTTGQPTTEAAVSKKGGGKMRLTKRKTARNLYAHAFLKDNAIVTAHEFDEMFKSLNTAVADEYHAMHLFAQDHQEIEEPSEVISAFAALPSPDRQVYKDRTRKDKKGKAKARG
ncbi:hypothetical protein BN946_scf184966.g1 [Trametes cinnabarina]|uniref:Uncharacterized protein n=1 Tax=Pycnoporus cinnabarinus TaxID=5643 RepID=A0A060SSC9_PYCCI|nr:hypothetical protein BN946_scf184966.g1 [Trametes cinnabarina]